MTLNGCGRLVKNGQNLKRILLELGRVYFYYIYINNIAFM